MDILKSTKLPNPQRGIALVLSLVILLAMTLVGVATMSGAALQERMVANQKRSSEATMSAQAALDMHFEWLAADPESRWDSGGWDGTTHSFGFGDQSVTRYRVIDWVNKSDGAPCSEDECIVIARGEVVANDSGDEKILARATLESEYWQREKVTPFAGPADILCESIFSSSKIALRSAVLHCNGDVNVNAKGNNNEMSNSRISASGTANVTVKEGNLDADSSVQSGTENVDIVSITELIQMTVDSISPGGELTIPGITESGDLDAASGTDLDIANLLDSKIDPASPAIADCGSASTPTCEFDFSDGDFSGQVHFCNGNSIIQGGGTAPANVTVISVCDIEHNGALNVAAGEVNNVFYSGGNMTFNGNTGPKGKNDPLFTGRFFGAGDVVFNGGVEVAGQMLFNGAIDANGEFTFDGSQPRGGNVPNLIEQLLVARFWRQSWE